MRGRGAGQGLRVALLINGTVKGSARERESGTERSEKPERERERTKMLKNAAVEMRCDVHGSKVRGILNRKCDRQRWMAERDERECGQAHSNPYLYSHETSGFKVQAKKKRVGQVTADCSVGQGRIGGIADWFRRMQQTCCLSRLSFSCIVLRKLYKGFI